MPQKLTSKDKILTALKLSGISLSVLQDQCIVTLFLSDNFIGNVNTVSGRWVGFINDRLLALQNHGTVHQVPAEYVEKILILEFLTKVTTEISF